MEVASLQVLKLFGLRVASELDLPLPTVEGEPEVTVRLGEVAAGGDLLWRTEPPLAFACFRQDRQIVLEWPGARFGVAVDSITVDLADPGFPVELYLNPVWSVLLAARGQDALHGCAVARGGRALAIHGISGSGKTTSGLALLDRGWQLVTDDLVTFDDNALVVPGPPFVRLLPDRAGDRAGTVDGAGKLRYHASACAEAVPLAAMIVLADEYAACARLTGLAAAHAILAQSYNPILTHPHQAARRFERALDLATRVPVFGAPPRSLSAEQLEWIAGSAGL